MRYYYAQEDDGTPCVVLVGVDPQGRDIVTGVVLELGWLCPPICGWETVLNADTQAGEATVSAGMVMEPSLHAGSGN